MNNKEMSRIIEDVIVNVIGSSSFDQLNKGIGTATPWGKAILDLCEMKKFLDSKSPLDSTEEKEKIFDLSRVSAVKIRFKKGIFEDDFPERGMKAWLTKIEPDHRCDCYKLYFDFTEFEEENDKYFSSDYYDSNGRPNKTAKEVNLYNPKYSVYFGGITWSIEKLNEELSKCIEIID